MKGFKEDWSAESMPLRKSREPEGKEMLTKECPICKRRVVFIDGQFSRHQCVSKEKN